LSRRAHLNVRAHPLQLYTTKLDRSKITEEQARRAERIAREIEESSKSKNNRKFGEVMQM
jgi:PAB1-binding protein PBP1